MLVSDYEYKSGQMDYPLHFHNEYEIIFVQSGIAEVNVNGAVYTASENSVLLLSRFDSHSIRIIKEPFYRFCIKIAPDYQETMLGNISAILKYHTGCCFKGNAGTKDIIKRLYHEMENNDKYSEELTASILKEFLVSVYRLNKECFENQTSCPQIYEVQKFIEENFQSDIKISEVCEKFYISHYYLSHMFKKIIGCSPKQYLILLRLNNAGRILSDTELSVSDAAFDSGFNDVNNFIRSFRMQFSMTPREYRKMRKKI